MKPEKARKYIRCTNEYKDDIKKAKTKLELIWYELEGVKGVSFDTVRGTDFSEYLKVAKHEKKEPELRYWEEVWKTAEKNLARNERILKQLPEDVREAVIRIYIDGETYEKVAADVHYSASGLYAKIDKAFLLVE